MADHGRLHRPTREVHRVGRDAAFEKEKAELDRLGQAFEDLAFERTDEDPTDALLQRRRQEIRRQMNVCWYYRPDARLRAPFHEEQIRS